MLLSEYRTIFPSRARGRARTGRRTPARCARPCLNADFRNAHCEHDCESHGESHQLALPHSIPLASSRYQHCAQGTTRTRAASCMCVFIFHWSHRRPAASVPFAGHPRHSVPLHRVCSKGSSLGRLCSVYLWHEFVARLTAQLCAEEEPQLA